MRTMVLMMVMSVAACAGDGAEDDTSADLDLLRTYSTDGGTWTVTYTPSIDPIPQSENFELLVDVEGEGAEALSLTWDAQMPLHGHGMNTQATTQRREDGSFDVTGMLFHMPGHWKMSGLLSDGETSETVIFDVQCCE